MYKNFEYLLQLHKVSSYKVAKEAGVTQTALSNWKSGRSKPSIQTLQKIADYFGVTVDYLTSDTPEIEHKNVLNSRDLKQKYMELEELLKSGKTAPLFFDGQPADAESIDLLLKQVEISLALIEKSVD